MDDGWTAEIAIPFKSLRYPGRQNEAHRWGFQIERTIESKNESVVWAPVSRNVMGMLSQMGVVEGMTGLSTTRNLEVLPTFTAIHADVLANDGHADHHHEPPGANSEGAINVKYGLTSDLVLARLGQSLFPWQPRASRSPFSIGSASRLRPSFTRANAWLRRSSAVRRGCTSGRA